MTRRGHPLKNARHERFAQALAMGRSKCDAYADAGFKYHGGNAAALAKKSDIQKRVAELLAWGEKSVDSSVTKAAISKEWVIDKLRSIAERCVEVAEGKKLDAAGANRALELLGRELGMFVERREVKHGTIDDLDSAARDELLSAIDRELASRAGQHPESGGTKPH